MPNLFSRLLSRGADKQLREFEKIAREVNDREAEVSALSDEELAGQTVLFRERYANGESLDDLLPEAFATVREASGRTLGLRHFDVQVIGGIALHRGMIAEMKTGEGKTLVSTLAGYLNAISGEGVHVVTVNDYLAKRDSEWMGQIYRFLGMKVGLLQNGMKLDLKKPAYEADVTYGTNSEFGFDYLRDNMVTRPGMRVQRGHHFAIVDEVDSILIDEARTPLIISGAGTKSASTYKDFARAVRGLVQDVDFEMDEAKHTIATTEGGLRKVEAALGVDDIYGDMSGQLVNHLQQALKAQYMFHRDQQYVVVDGEVKIVDEFTGRIMEGRRYSEGLHQAIEAKEGVLIREENQTLATITLQNYFRLYDKLSGMTGTAMTEDAEFREIYKLPVQAIPPNKPVIRVDGNDLVYQTIDAKFRAVAEDVAQRHAKGQPCLVGTVSIESSERLSRILDKRGIRHEVLNAKYHEREAQIVAQAGREGAVTIATNMAGRGTDILLGGNPTALAEDLLAQEGVPDEEVTEEQRADALERARKICATEREHVVAAGGLCVIGTERHESRRIDNQLRGRSGRQGDPGETVFYLSLDDDLMRLFGGDRMDHVAALMAKYDMPADMPIESKMVTKAVESAQRKVEEINFSMRKNVLDYDDVMNKQRQVIYEERNKILDGKDLVGHIAEVLRDTVEHNVDLYCSEDINASDWDFEGLLKWVAGLTGRSDLPELDEDMERADVLEAVCDYVSGCYAQKSERLSDAIMQELSAQVMLRVIDTRWMAYLQEMDYLKTGIGLRGFGQRDPLVEYKTEAYAAFTELVNTMYEDFLRTILRIELAHAPEPREDDGLRGASFSGPAEVDGDRSGSVVAARASDGRHGATPAATKPGTYRKEDDPDPYVGVGRNDPCPCGSGKKFKNCHGRNR
ncbi:preprotein translocase, SecA subunit [Olsenella sp. oral taxon 809 str. F0356]|uniref:preprotein translocase subunit SecA n=1 Tax=Olsenella sp. oral taxon 809 TaxID=661086 RepID=UPI000231F0F7|nr:preprotein translocase subunit SecA [Olsenella sp. oral taxon 809]EHF02735.1 preprotein translocase, SecA subunit [Olsenella sp. oral taxon 809 str. F0356]